MTAILPTLFLLAAGKGKGRRGETRDAKEVVVVDWPFSLKACLAPSTAKTHTYRVLCVHSVFVQWSYPLGIGCLCCLLSIMSNSVDPLVREGRLTPFLLHLSP